MALSDKKLYFRKSTGTQICKLYTTSSELTDMVQNYSTMGVLCVRAENETLFTLVGQNIIFMSGVSYSIKDLTVKTNMGINRVYDITLPQHNITLKFKIRRQTRVQGGITEVQTSYPFTRNVSFRICGANSSDDEINTVTLTAGNTSVTNSSTGYYVLQSPSFTTVYIFYSTGTSYVLATSVSVRLSSSYNNFTATFAI